jgi:hypothetical protein
VPKAPPEQSKGGSEWGTDDGHRHSRPLVDDDQNGVLLPGMSFDNFDDFLPGARPTPTPGTDLWDECTGSHETDRPNGQ